MIAGWLAAAIEPFAYPFMREAFLAIALVSIPMALLSCLLVLRGWALMGDAIAHAVLPGIVIAHLLALPLALGAFLAGLACAGASGFLTRSSRVKPDTVLGVVFSSMFALGLVLLVAFPSDLHLDHILFGDLLGLSARDLAETAVIAAAITGFVLLRRRDLALHAFDPAHARAIGLRTGVLHYGLLAAVSLAVVAALKAVGLILSVALLIAPGACAFLVVKRFGAMLAFAALAGLGCGLLGVWLSFLLDSAPAPTVVLLLTALFLALLLLRGAAPAGVAKPSPLP